MTTAGEIGKARGGCGSRGNRRTLGDSAQLLVSGDSRRSHSPATTKIEKKRIESEERTRRPALPGHFSNGRIHHPNPVTQETGYLHRILRRPAISIAAIRSNVLAASSIEMMTRSEAAAA